MAKIRLGKVAVSDFYDDWFRLLESLYFRRRQKTPYRFWFWDLKSSEEVRTQRGEFFWLLMVIFRLEFGVSVRRKNWKYHSAYLRNEIEKAMKSEVDQLGL